MASLMLMKNRSKQNSQSCWLRWFVPALFLIFLSPLSFFPFKTVLGAVQDTDFDGLADEAEKTIYATDPLLHDTDQDTIPDGQEILDGTNPLNKDDSELSNFDAAIGKPLVRTDSFAWYVGRASGIFAFILLSLVVINGLLISTRLAIRFISPALNYEMHRFFSWAALLATLIHIISFIFDKYIKLQWFEIFLPFSLKRPFPTALGYSLELAVGFGVLSLYGILILILTSHFKAHLSQRVWRITHYLSFLTYLFFLGHGIFAGSDSLAWWMIWIYGFSTTLVITLIFIRIRQSVHRTTPTPSFSPHSPPTRSAEPPTPTPPTLPPTTQ